MKKKDRLTICLFVEWLDNLYDPYDLNIFRMLDQIAEKRDVNLLCIQMGSFYSPDNFNSLNTTIHKRIIQEKVDGFILSAGSVTGFSNKSYYKEFYNLYRAFPMVSCAYVFENIPSIVVDNKQGMYDLVKHLITIHDYHRIAFVKGPDFNYDANLRYTAFLSVLSDFDIPVFSRMIVNGDFTYDSGVYAVKVLLDHRQTTPEVIIAADGQMAAGVLYELISRGIKVPEDIAVVRFDDIYSSDFPIPFTSVQQPMDGICQKAMELILRLIAGEKVPDVTTIPPKTIIRESCGCLYQNRGIKKEAFFDEDRCSSAIFNNTKLLFSHIKYRDLISIINNLVSSFFSDLEKDDSTDFLKTLDSVLERKIWYSNNLFAWECVVKEIDKAFSAFLSDGKRISRARFLIHEGRINILRRNFKEEKLKQYKLESQRDTLNLLHEEILLVHSMEKQIHVFSDHLMHFGIAKFQLCQYDPNSRNREARLLFLYNEKERPKLECRSIDNSLILGELKTDSRYTFIVTSLGFCEEQLGFMVIKINLKECLNIFGMLRVVNSVLVGIISANMIKKQTKHLTTQEDQLRQADKMISLGTLVAGVAHEINNPNNSILLSSEMNDKAWKIIKNILREEIKRAKNKKIGNMTFSDLIEDFEESFSMIIRNSKRIKQIVDDLRNFARKDTRALEKIDINFVIRTTVRLMKNLIGSTAGNFSIKLEEGLPLFKGNPQKLEQVFVNIIHNACQAIDPANGKLIITTAYEKNDKQIVIIIEDNGVGMNGKTLKQILDPFFTTKRGMGGLGLGLSISHKIIKDHSGALYISSKPGLGTTVKIVFPFEKVTSGT